MSALLDAYAAQFKITFAVQVQYRVAMGIYLIGMIFQPTVYLVVWSTVARAQGGQVGGYDPRDFAAYFITMMLTTHWTFTWIMHEFEFEVRMGRLSPKLLRPLHPLHTHVADNVSYKLLTSIVMVPAALILAWVFQARLEPQGWSLALALPSIAMAFAARLLIGYTVALAAFWTTRVLAINEMYFLTDLFMSGIMAPLALLPPVLQTVANALPFRWNVGFPVELILGRLPVDQALRGLGVQLFWLLVIGALFRLLWNRGVKRYSAVGA